MNYSIEFDCLCIHSVAFIICRSSTFVRCCFSFSFVYFKILLFVAGMIPAPVLFGALIDRACLAWQQQPCNSEKGSCFTYDNWSMGTYFLTLVFCCKGLSLLFFVIALLLYRPPTTNSDVAVVEVCDGSSTGVDAAPRSSPSSLPLLNSNGEDDISKYSALNDNQKKSQTATDIWILHSPCCSDESVLCWIGGRLYTISAKAAAETDEQKLRSNIVVLFCFVSNYCRCADGKWRRWCWLSFWCLLMFCILCAKSLYLYDVLKRCVHLTFYFDVTLVSLWDVVLLALR